MRRHLGLIVVYAFAAALILAAPLAASEEPPQALIQEAVPPVEPPAAPEEALSTEAPPAEVSPAEAPPPEAPPTEAPPQDAAPEPRSKTQPAVAKAASGTVTISDFEFAPASITISVGDTVTWSNAGPTPHSATGDSFDTDIFEEGESRSQTFNEAGTFDYICTPHPDMKGTVIVRAAAAQGGDDGGSTDAGTDAAAGDSTGTDTGSADGSADDPTLPATGVDAGGLFALGLITLALGALLRRRTARTG